MFFSGQVTGERERRGRKERSLGEAKMTELALEVKKVETLEEGQGVCVFCPLTPMVPNKFLVLVFVLLLALGVAASRLL